jgi:hypothetical protein
VPGDASDQRAGENRHLEGAHRAASCHTDVRRCEPDRGPPTGSSVGGASTQRTGLQPQIADCTRPHRTLPCWHCPPT